MSETHILQTKCQRAAELLSRDTAAIETKLELERPTGRAGRNPPSTADSAELQGCARRQRR